MGHYKDGSSEYTRNYLSLSDLETPEILITQSQSQNIISILHIIWWTMSRGAVSQYDKDYFFGLGGGVNITFTTE